MFRLLIVTVIAAALVAGSAAAQPALSNAVHIKVTDADLHTPAGARKLAFRIRVAAYKVCEGGLPHGREAADFDTCRQTAIQRAIAGVDAPMLAQALGLGGVALAQSRQ
jgi:UrcA family protein